MRIGIAGAGLLGRLCGFQLIRAGHHVTLFDTSTSQNPGPESIRAAAWTAAGMLSPVAEMETGGDEVRVLGERSLELWRKIDGDLKTNQGLSAQDSGIGLQLQDSLMVCHGGDLGSAQRVLRLLASDTQRVIKLQDQEAIELAPGLKRGLHAWQLRGEGHLYPGQAMLSLAHALHDADWRLGTAVREVKPHTVILDHGPEQFDWVFDTRGTGAAEELPVRGVRGEVISLFAPGFELHRAVRLLHPRWRVYLVPRPQSQLIIGATEIESEDRSPISVQSMMELLSAAFSIFPSLAEARIISTDVNLRPATPDNLPLIRTQDGITRINGLFRHGWLLAPAVIEKALGNAGLN